MAQLAQIWKANHFISSHYINWRIKWPSVMAYNCFSKINNKDTVT